MKNKLNGLRNSIIYLKNNRLFLSYTIVLAPILSIIILLLSNPFFSLQSLLFDLTSIKYVIYENYWLLEHTAGWVILPIGLIYTYTVSILFILTYKQLQINNDMNSYTNILGIIPSFFIGCAGCSAGILGLFTTTGLAVLPFSSFTITYILIILGFTISIYSINKIGNPEVCNL